jgi:hypothetical protein
MSNTFPYTSPNNSSEIVMYAGSDYQLTFNVYDSSGNAVSLAGAVCSWALSYYSDPTPILTLSTNGGIISGSATNKKIVNVSGSSTGTPGLNLSGKFIHQFKVVSSSGSTYVPTQGIVNIFPARI